MVAAMAASLETLETNPHAGPSKCEVCLRDPHPVEECPLVNRLATGVEEKPEKKEEEKGNWQEVKVPRAAGKEQKKGIEKQRQHQGKGQTAPASKVLTVRRGTPVNG